MVKSCIKPLNQDVKIDYALSTSSIHYDAFKGEQFAIAADGQVCTLMMSVFIKFINENKIIRKTVVQIDHHTGMRQWTGNHTSALNQWKI